MRKIIFIKAIDRRDSSTTDMFGQHSEARTRKDGVVQKYHVGKTNPSASTKGGQANLPWSIPNKTLRASVLDKWGSVAEPISGYDFLVGKVKKTEQPIFIVDGTFDREAFKRVIGEAGKANLNTTRLVIVCDQATYIGGGLVIMLFNEFAPGTINRS